MPLRCKVGGREQGLANRYVLGVVFKTSAGMIALFGKFLVDSLPLPKSIKDPACDQNLLISLSAGMALLIAT